MCMTELKKLREMYTVRPKYIYKKTLATDKICSKDKEQKIVSIDTQKTEKTGISYLILHELTETTKECIKCNMDIIKM